MTEVEIIQTVNAALAKEFELEVSEMTPEKNLFEDLGLDSLDMVDMVIVLEQTFTFKIRDEEEVRQIRTLGDIHRFILLKKTALS